jgi:hypothetical protein
MSTEDNKAIARRLYEEALNTGDIAVVDELVAPTIVLHYDYPADIAGPAENQLGLEAIKHFVSHLRTTFIKAGVYSSRGRVDRPPGGL